MSYTVVYVKAFDHTLDTQVGYLLNRGAGVETVERWLAGLLELIDGLYELPHRYPVDTFQSEAVGRDIRRITYGDYLIFYQIDEGRRRVEVISFRHGARRGGEGKRW